MSNCTSCTQLAPISKADGGCKNVKNKLTDVRIYCCETITETLTATSAPDCPSGYISDLVVVDPIATPTPLVAVEILNEDDVDETNDYTFDRATDTGEDTYVFNPLIKVLTPEHQCTLDSMKGQDVCMVYKIENKTGDYVWRRFKGKLSAVSGGLVNGYNLTFDTLNPDDMDKPLFVNIGGGAATEAALDAITQF
jgi:hypothetical protein